MLKLNNKIFLPSHITSIQHLKHANVLTVILGNPRVSRIVTS